MSPPKAKLWSDRDVNCRGRTKSSREVNHIRVGITEHQPAFDGLFTLLLSIVIVAGLLPPIAHSQIQFEEVTEAAGVSYSGQSWGASWGDFSGDGKPDLWVTNHLAAPSLFSNNGDGTFTDVRSDIYVADIAADTHGGAWADFDNDGDQDLLVLVGAQQGIGIGPNLMLVNDNGLLEDRATQLGLDDPLGRSRTPLWFDWNRDGLLDVLAVTWPRSDAVEAPSSLFEQSGSGFTDVSGDVGLQSTKWGNYAQISYITSAETPVVIVHSTWYPQNVYDFASGLFEEIKSSVMATISKVWDTAIADFNGDTRPDIFLTRLPDPWGVSHVAQDSENSLKARLIANGDDKGITFRSTTMVTFDLYIVPVDQVHIGSGGYVPASRNFTLDPADPAVSGLMPFSPGTDTGFYIGYHPDTQTWELALSNPGRGVVNLIVQSATPIADMVPRGFDPADNVAPDNLVINVGGVLQDYTHLAGLSGDTSCQSVVPGDFDNDMDVDLYLVCSSPVHNLPNRLYENLGGGSFVSVAGAGGAAGTTLGLGETVVTADYDQDGFLDLFVTNGQFNPPFNRGPSQLFRNLGNDHHWIEIDLEGVASNRDGIGAQVYVTAGGVTQWREQGGGMHRAAQNHPRLHFGLAANAAVTRIEVLWPSGLRQVIDNVAADQIFRIVESVADSDGDGVYDHLDNCLQVANADQRDTDSDDYGNICDPDLDNDGSVGWSDLAELELVYLTNNPDADFDGNGTVDSNDRLLLESYLFGSPGPSLVAGDPPVPEAGIDNVIAFREVTVAAGISYTGQSVGASWGDFDADGCPDIWASNHYTYPSLYVNQCDGNFRDVAHDVIAVRPRDDSHGAAWADFDNDGDQDLFEANADFFNALYVNDDLTLVDQAAVFGVQGCPISNDPCPNTLALSPLWLDWSRDGRLDLFISHQIKIGAPPPVLFEWLDGTFSTANEYVGIQVPDSADFAQLSDLSGDGAVDLLVHGLSFPNAVYDMSAVPFVEFGSSTFPVVSNVKDMATVDVDGDLDVDMVFAGGVNANDAMQTDDRTIQVRLVTSSGNTERGISFRSTGAVLFDLHPFLDLSQVFVGAQGSNPTSLPFTLAADDPTTWGLAEHLPGADSAIYVGYDPMAQEWSLLLSRSGYGVVTGLLTADDVIDKLERINFAAFQGSAGLKLLLQENGDFVDATVEAGVEARANCFSLTAADFDNDMDIDLYFACNRPAGNMTNLLYENDGMGSFSLVHGLGDATGTRQGRGDSVTTGDFDGDGFLDLFLTNSDWTPPLTGPHQLLKNEGNDNHWIAIDLEGVVSNRDGIGARLLATAGGTTQLREQSGGMHRFSQDHQRVHFGLGVNTSVERLTVHWPSGIVQEINNMPADQVIRITEPGPVFAPGKPVYIPGQDAGVYLWKEAFDGPYHLRVSGDGPLALFDTTILAERAFEAVVPLKLEANDIITHQENTLSLASRVTTGEDGVDFTLPPGTAALIAVEQDGVPNPRQLHAGPSGAPIAPAGFVLNVNELPSPPPFEVGQDLGLFIGHSAAGNVIARWNGDGFAHRTTLRLVSSNPLLHVEPVGLDLHDTLTEGPYHLQVSGWISTWWDGVDVSTAPDSTLGICYEQDGLFQSHRVNPLTRDLGFPNAYTLPIAVGGEPVYDAATEKGLYIWLDEDGTWHLRVTAGGDFGRYTGAIVASAPYSEVTGVALEANDLLDVSDPTQILFDLRVRNQWTDGIDFAFPKGTGITLQLNDNTSTAAELVNIGGERWPVNQLPVQLQRSTP